MKEGNEESKNEGGRERTKEEKLIGIRRKKTHEKGESVNADPLRLVSTGTQLLTAQFAGDRLPARIPCF
jgi:hypothetical protein